MRTRTRPFSRRRLLQLTAGTVAGLTIPGARLLATQNRRFFPPIDPSEPDPPPPSIPLDRADRPCPFRVHGDSFQILSRNGVPPPAHEGGWKDVALVHPNETVRIIKRLFD